MMVSLACLLAGSNGTWPYQHIGDEYLSSTPVFHLRLLPAILGSTVVPIAYAIMVELQFCRWTALLAATLLLIENAILVQTRLLLVDGPFLCCMLLAVLLELKFEKVNQSYPFSWLWWFLLVSLGLAVSSAICIRHTGLCTAVLVVMAVGFNFWNFFPQLSSVDIVRHILARVACLLVVPVIFYVGVYYVHVNVLNRSGPNDYSLSSAFQASLEGGLSDITRNQPTDVAFGSQITLRRTHGSPCWLYSDESVYPIYYDDGRGSSHQQQVSCVTNKDVNNWWIVKDPKRDVLTTDDPIRPIRNGDVIQLMHGMTQRPLNSHDVAAPMSPQHQEVSCYIRYEMSLPEMSLWQVKLMGAADNSSVWKSISSRVHLIHVNTSHALKTTAKYLDVSGRERLEVVSDRLHNQPDAVWNVEEHSYTLDQSKKAKVTSVNADTNYQLGFWGKFWELQTKMFALTSADAVEHRYSSSPLTWPLMKRNIIYWIDSETNAQIHFLGNPVIWFTALAALLIYSCVYLVCLLRRRRACFDFSEERWQQFSNAGHVLLSAYVFHYAPYLFIDGATFLYQYLPALIFSIMLLAVLIDQLGAVVYARTPHAFIFYVAVVIGWLSVAVWTFKLFGAVTYGRTAMTSDLLDKLRWFGSSWDFVE